MSQTGLWTEPVDLQEVFLAFGMKSLSSSHMSVTTATTVIPQPWTRCVQNINQKPPRHWINPQAAAADTLSHVTSND